MKLFYLNFKQALRNLRRQAWQAGISIAGLAFGIVCLTCSLNWLWTETHYDSFRPGYKQLYVLQKSGEYGYDPFLPYSLYLQLDSTLNGIGSAGVFRPSGSTRFFHPDSGQELGRKVEALEISPGTARILKNKVLFGSMEEVLKDNNRIAISREQAIRLFNTENAVGRTIKTGGSLSGSTLRTVGAVLEDMKGPSNLPTHLVSALASSENRYSWSNWSHRILICTKDTAETLRRIRQLPMPEHFIEQAKVRDFHLPPLRTFHKLGQSTPF